VRSIGYRVAPARVEEQHSDPALLLCGLAGGATGWCASEHPPAFRTARQLGRVPRLEQRLAQQLVGVRVAARAHRGYGAVEVVVGAPVLDVGAEQQPVGARAAPVRQAHRAGVDDPPRSEPAVELRMRMTTYDDRLGHASSAGRQRRSASARSAAPHRRAANRGRTASARARRRPAPRAGRTTPAGRGGADRSPRRSRPPKDGPGVHPPRSSHPAHRTRPPPSDRRCRARTRPGRRAPVAARASPPAADPAPRRPRPRSCRPPRARPRRARHRAPGRWRGCRIARQRAWRRHAGKPPHAPSPRRDRRPATRRRLAYSRALLPSKTTTSNARLLERVQAERRRLVGGNASFHGEGTPLLTLAAMKRRRALARAAVCEEREHDGGVAGAPGARNALLNVPGRSVVRKRLLRRVARTRGEATAPRRLSSESPSSSS
jgi:hypothetical protein